MSARTAADHCHTELEYVAADDLNETVAFRARSASKPGTYNTIQLCILTGETLCDCRGAEIGKPCWHADLVAVAWLNHAAVCLARRYNDTQLRTAGRKAKRMIDAYRGRSWRVLPADQLSLLACHTAYRERWSVALSAAEVAAVA
jgi:hypothetical protein